MARKKLVIAVGLAWLTWLSVALAYEARMALSSREIPIYETARFGDFDGDGKPDLATFTRNKPDAVGQVHVARWDGTQFVNNRGRRGRGTLWHGWFAISDAEQILVGDFDGDGKDDLGTWLGTTNRELYVALSDGARLGEARVWASNVGFDASDTILSGDMNGDGRDDIVCFSPSREQVTISYSTGSGFGPPEVEWFKTH
jgi:hypothetical protein